MFVIPVSVFHCISTVQRITSYRYESAVWGSIQTNDQNWEKNVISSNVMRFWPWHDCFWYTTISTLLWMLQYRKKSSHCRHQFCGFRNEKAQGTMARLVWADRNAAVTQFLILRLSYLYFNWTTCVLSLYKGILGSFKDDEMFNSPFSCLLFLYLYFTVFFITTWWCHVTDVSATLAEMYKR